MWGHNMTAAWHQAKSSLTCCVWLCCRNTQVGMPSNRACSSCHSSMSVHFQTAAFVAAAPRNSSHDQPKQRRQKQAQGSRGRAAAEPAPVVGQPLPHMGTCKHYHHSHRCRPHSLVQAYREHIQICIQSSSHSLLAD